MAKEGRTLAIQNYEEIFSMGAPQNGEAVQMVALTELHAPDLHPFQVNDDEAMTRLVDSIKADGVHEPGIVRKRAEGGGYELLCGNRRKRACELAGLSEMPVIVRELDDDSAVIAMIDSNLQAREKILHSERAFAYKMKMEALNHNGVKADQNSCDVIAAQMGDSAAQIFRFIRLTELIEVMLDKLDAKKLSFTAAVELSYLSYDEQRVVADFMDSYGVKPSQSQANRLKKLKQAGELTAGKIEKMLAEEKKPPKDEPKGALRFRKYFPPDYTREQMNAVIVNLLKDWKPEVTAQ